MTAKPADKVQGPAYQTEHWLAWAMAAIAIVFGAIGLLVGFGWIGETGVVSPTEADTPGAQFEVLGLWDAAIWMLPAIMAALLALDLHQSGHHWMRDPERLSSSEKGLWRAEHFGAWLMALVTIALGAITMLVGFDVLGGGYNQADGVLWGLAGLVTAVLTVALHAVRHHQMATEEDYIVAVVQERVLAPGMTTGPVVREPGIERR